MTTGFRRTNRRRDGRYTPRRRVCQFCEGKVDSADYKDIPLLNRFINDRARMEPRRRTGTCARHQRMVSRAIKRARAVALMPIHSSHEKVFISQLSREQKVADVAPKTPEIDSATSEVSPTVSDSETVEAPVVTEEPAVASQEEDPAVIASTSATEEPAVASQEEDPAVIASTSATEEPAVASQEEDPAVVASTSATEEPAVASQEEDPAVVASTSATEEPEEAASPVVTSEETNAEEKPSQS